MNETTQPAVAGPVESTVRRPVQGGLTNAELTDAWCKNLPGVVPTERDLTAFALGVEVGREIGLQAAAAVREIERLREHAVVLAATVEEVEREACADICDQHASAEGIAQRCAAAIRARGKE